MAEVEHTNLTVEAGDTFDSWDQFQSFLEKYSEATYQKFAICDSRRVHYTNAKMIDTSKLYLLRHKYSAAKLACVHYGKPRSRGKGIRPNQSTFRTDCKVNINIRSDRRLKKLLVSSVNLEHNHEISKELYLSYPSTKKLTSAELLVAKRLCQSNEQTSQICFKLRKITGKPVTAKDIQNLKRRFREHQGATSENSLSLSDYCNYEAIKPMEMEQSGIEADIHEMALHEDSDHNMYIIRTSPQKSVLPHPAVQLSKINLRRIVDRCNTFLLPDSSRKQCHPFYVDGKLVGLIRPEILLHLWEFKNVFTVSTSPPGVHLSEKFVTFEEKSSIIAEVLSKLREAGNLVTLKGWRNEAYDVKPSMSEPPLLKIERSASCLFGTLQYGCHINGYTHDVDGQLMMWIARRSKTKQTYPNMLDNMVAGGLTAGLGYRECAIKECQEEASVSDECLKELRSVGCVSYAHEDERGIFPECEFVFDLLLPQDFKPVCSDGEAQSFELVPIDKLIDLICGPDFKPNSALVILDFLIRHGVITPDNEPSYAYLQEMMHIPLQTYFRTGSIF